MFNMILWKVIKEIQTVLNVNGFYNIIREIFNEYSYVHGQLFWNIIFKHFKLQVSTSKGLTYLYEYMTLLKIPKWLRIFRI